MDNGNELSAALETKEVFPPRDDGEAAYGGFPFYAWLAVAGELLPAWWSQARDNELRKFWKLSDHLAGTVNTLRDMMVAMPVKVVARDNSIKSYVRKAEEYTRILQNNSESRSNFTTQGWSACYGAFIEDYHTIDNGAFMVVEGPGRGDEPLQGPPTRLIHLDGCNCWRTQNPEFPIIYTDMDGARYRLHKSRVISLTAQSTPISSMYGVGFCLHGDSCVEMADGSTKRIRDIVREQDIGPVLSFDGRTGKIVPKKITNWYKNPHLNRKMVNIRGEVASFVRGSKSKNSWMTEDHPVLTPSGWINAGSLKDGDKIITALPKPNENQVKFLVGTLLGDSSLVKQYDRARFSVGHKKDQEGWFDIKASVLEKDFGFKKRNGTSRLEYKNKTNVYECLNGQTLAQAGFNELYKEFYKNGKKIAPLELVKENISPVMLASWYMDDGSIVDREKNERNRRPHARLATNGFSVAEVEELAVILTDNGYESTVISARGDKDKRNIRISANGSKKFFDDIAPYIPPCMRYKIPANSNKFDPGLWDLGQADVVVDRVVVKHRKTLNKDRNRGRKRRSDAGCGTVYCIDVEDTHNFITSGVVVHNCAVSRAVNVSQNLIDNGRYKQEKLGSRPHRGLIAIQDSAGGEREAQAVSLALRATDEMMDNQGLTRYARVPVVSVKGSLALIDLASLPDGFDQMSDTQLGMAVLALAFGVDMRQLAFAFGVAGQTKADAEVQHLKMRGKGPGVIIGQATQQIEAKFLPPYLKLIFDYQDDEQDKLNSEIRKLRSERREKDLSLGVTDIRTEREGMVESGEITEAQFIAMELADGRTPDGEDVLALFQSPEYTEVLPPLDATPEQIEEAIQKMQRVLMSNARSKIKVQASMALAALQKLKGLRMAEPMMEAGPDSQEEMAEEEPETDTEDEITDQDEKAMSRITYNGVTVMASGQQSSTRPDKKYMRTVSYKGKERVVHYGDPNMTIKKNDPARRKAFMARHSCSEKKDPFSPGFWSCYGWKE